MVVSPIEKGNELLILRIYYTVLVWVFRRIILIIVGRHHLKYVAILRSMPFAFRYMLYKNTYRQTFNISRTLLSNTTVDHSDVVGAPPVSAAPTASSFSTWHIVSMDWAKPSSRRDEKHLRLDLVPLILDVLFPLGYITIRIRDFSYSYIEKHMKNVGSWSCFVFIYPCKKLPYPIPPIY